MKKTNKTTQAKPAKVKIAEAKVRIAQRELVEAKKALKEAETQTINGYSIAELGKGRFIDLSESVFVLDDDGATWAVQLPAESKYAGKYLVWGYCDYEEYINDYYDILDSEDDWDDEDEDDEDGFDPSAYWDEVGLSDFGREFEVNGEEAYAMRGYITDSTEGITRDDITWGRVRGIAFEEEIDAGQNEVVFEIDEDTNEYFVSDPCRTGTAGLYFGKDAYRFAHNVNSVSFGIRPKLDDDDED